MLSTLGTGTQVGMVLNADRSFAAKCNGGNAGAVLPLKEVTGVGGVGLAVTDTMTIAGVTYTIASVAGGSNVAYNDTTKTQTVTLGSDPGVVADDAKVGLNWASWNGVLVYFDGAGNIKLDEVKAGVYTNRGSTAIAFAADKRLIVRKIGQRVSNLFQRGFQWARPSARLMLLLWRKYLRDVQHPGSEPDNQHMYF